MDVKQRESTPAECRGVDIDAAASRLPQDLSELYLVAAEQRLTDLNKAMAEGNAEAVMDAVHSLASITGLLPITELQAYARSIYAAGQGHDLASARHAHERVNAILGWAIGRLRARGSAAGAD